MFDKAAFLASLKHEAKILKHLAAQLTPAHLDYRPTPAQRSTLELLRYLTIAGSAALEYAITGTWDHWEATEKRSADVDLASFPKAIDRQLKSIEKALAGYTDAKLRRARTRTFAGVEMTLGAGLVEMVLKQFTAYRMQLFLYAKSAGLAQLGTSDLWAGRSPKPPKPAKKAKAAKTSG